MRLTLKETKLKEPRICLKSTLDSRVIIKSTFYFVIKGQNKISSMLISRRVYVTKRI